MTQHSVIIGAALSRTIVASYYSAPTSNAWPLGVVAFFSCLPYLFTFYLFSLMIFQWCGIYAYAMSGGDPFAKVRKPFYALNVAYAVVTCIMFIGSVSGGSSQRQNFAVAGTWIMALVSIGVGVGFLLFASLLARTLAQTMGRLTNTKNQTLIRKLYALGGVTATCYVLMAVFWILSVTQQSGFRADSAAYTAPFLSFDLIAICGSLAMFMDGVNGTVAKNAPDKDASSTNPNPQSGTDKSKSGSDRNSNKTASNDKRKSGLVSQSAGSDARLVASSPASVSAVGSSSSHSPAHASLSDGAPDSHAMRQHSMLGIGSGVASPLETTESVAESNPQPLQVAEIEMTERLPVAEVPPPPPAVSVAAPTAVSADAEARIEIFTPPADASTP